MSAKHKNVKVNEITINSSCDTYNCIGVAQWEVGGVTVNEYL